MKKIFFTLYTGFCGSDGHEIAEFEDNVTDDQLDRYAHEVALTNAEMYGIYPTEAMPEDYDEDSDIGGDEYSDNIGGDWKPYVAELHEGYL